MVLQEKSNWWMILFSFASCCFFFQSCTEKTVGAEKCSQDSVCERGYCVSGVCLGSHNRWGSHSLTLDNNRKVILPNVHYLIKKKPVTEQNSSKNTTKPFTGFYPQLPSKIDLIQEAYKLGCKIPIHSQGACGWCVQHATAAMFELGLCLEKTNKEANISEVHLRYLVYKDMAFVNDCEKGTYPHKQFGPFQQNDLWILPSKYWEYPTPIIQDDWAKQPEKIQRLTLPGEEVLRKGLWRPNLTSEVELQREQIVERAKFILAGGRPLFFSLPVITGKNWWINGWVDYQKPSIFARRCTRESKTGSDCRCKEHEDCSNDEMCVQGRCSRGSHAVLLVGYNDEKKEFLFQNSWGESWGDKGFGRISYKAFELLAEPGSFYYFFRIVSRKTEISGVPKEVNGFLKKKDLEDFKRNGLRVYTGKAPPNIEGTYRIDSLKVLYDSANDYIQNINAYTCILKDQTKEGRIGFSCKNDNNDDRFLGSGAFISGNGNCFSVFVDIHGQDKTCSYRRAMIMSGCKVQNGIENYQEAFLMSEKTGTSCDKLMNIGQKRILVESDKNVQKIVQ